MRHWRWLVGLGVVLGCGGDDGTGPGGLPEIAGTYQGVLAFSFQNAVETINNSDPVSVTLQNARSDGTFSGTVIVTGGGSGEVRGTLRSDGGITITQFGPDDPNNAFVSAVFYWCTIPQAASSGMSGSVQGRQLQLQSVIVMPCHYTNPTSTFQSTITISVSGNR